MMAARNKATEKTTCLPFRDSSQRQKCDEKRKEEGKCELTTVSPSPANSNCKNTLSTSLRHTGRKRIDPVLKPIWGLFDCLYSLYQVATPYWSSFLTWFVFPKRGETPNWDHCVSVLLFGVLTPNCCQYN